MDDIQIFFSDITINEADCSRSVVDKLMNRDVPRGTEWMLSTEVAMTNGFDESLGALQFWNNGEAILTGFESGFTEEIVPVDAIYLNDYLSENGWDFVVDESLVEGNPEFWDKYFSAIEEDDDMLMEEDPYGDYDVFDEQDNFVEYAARLKEYKKPTANKYNVLNLEEFENHEYDLNKRKEREEDNKF